MSVPVEVGTGGRTKFNRTRRKLLKVHWLDAACVGKSTPERLLVRGIHPLLIRATGHGNRQMCGTNASGFPIRHRQRQKRWFGMETGDMVRAVIPIGKYAGVHVGRVAVRSRPKFKLRGFDVHPKYLTLIQRHDGFAYNDRLPAHAP